ncbi:MAG: hypothetical protein Unbinned202contig1002_50 [Prokaryotic dsDNA virus sp.]|nr:MAG: hypothetical protein Unbinned202contig1002_50 [Prokaryotic dsDNA virus sp.]|tara:strand:+ start:23361 stop:24056 length:696 start_codon:yes stop_codon:yes gene_type:complete
MPPKITPAIETFMADIALMEKKFNADLAKLTKRLQGMSDTELIRTMQEANFFQEVIDAGYGDALNKLDGEYAKVLQEAVKEAKKRGVDVLGTASIEGLETLQELNYNRLIGMGEIYADNLKSQLFQSVYTGGTPADIIAGLGETNLATHQMNVLAYDSLKIFDDTARYKVFQGQDVRWTYVGPIDDRTRDACLNTAGNEPKNGYTEKEVNSSDTPFGVRGGFNCRHSWMIL